MMYSAAVCASKCCRLVVLSYMSSTYDIGLAGVKSLCWMHATAMFWSGFVSVWLILNSWLWQIFSTRLQHFFDPWQTFSSHSLGGRQSDADHLVKTNPSSCSLMTCIV